LVVSATTFTMPECFGFWPHWGHVAGCDVRGVICAMAELDRQKASNKKHEHTASVDFIHTSSWNSRLRDFTDKLARAASGMPQKGNQHSTGRKAQSRAGVLI